MPKYVLVNSSVEWHIAGTRIVPGVPFSAIGPIAGHPFLRKLFNAGKIVEYKEPVVSETPVAEVKKVVEATAEPEEVTGVEDPADDDNSEQGWKKRKKGK